MSNDILSNIKKATQATHDALNAWDLDALVAIRTDDFVFQRLPNSLELPPMNNEQYADMFKNQLTPGLKSFKVEPKLVMHDAEPRRSTTFGAFSADTPAGPRKWELIQMMSFDASGSKLTRLDEFFDSHVYLEMMKSMQE